MSVSEQAYVTLNTGAKMPAIGLGCWSGTTREQQDSAQPWIVSALKVGYRHIDTAHNYGTERAVGRAVREAGTPREEIHVTTKLPENHHRKVAESIDESLKNAGFDYYDLWLMHWPVAFANINENAMPRHPGPDGEPGEGDFILDDSISFNETWAEMEKVLETGKVKAIGVSNFSVKNLKKLLETAKIVPAVNQVEMHPYQTQAELVKFCKEKGIVVTAYTPTGYSSVVGKDPVIIELAEKYKTSAAQVALAWHLARGCTAVPKSADPGRQRGNIFEQPKLFDEDVKLINSLHKDAHLCNYPGPHEVNGVKMALGWSYERLGW